MRIESTNARTWLAAAVAGWAVVVWGLALAGLGSRIAEVDDAGAAPVAPAALPAPAEQAPLSSYTDIAARPLFAADRRPHPFFIDPSDEGDGASGGFDYVLTSVLRTPGFAMAILQPGGGGESIRLRVGDAPPDASGWVLDSVDARSVVFAGPDGPRTLELRVYDGIGGQPPTPMRPPAPADGERVQAGTGRRGAAASSGPVAPTGAPRPPPPTRAGSAAATTAPAPAPPGAVAEPAQAAPPPGSAGTSEAQVEAIRRRIEERRARLQQEQATGGQAP